jgi:hypothetical protein
MDTRLRRGLALAVVGHSIPSEDKAEWRDSRITRAYAEAAFASDRPATPLPITYRSNEDSFYPLITVIRNNELAPLRKTAMIAAEDQLTKLQGGNRDRNGRTQGIICAPKYQHDAQR